MTAQFPINGKPGKAWSITSKMGWRIHPVHKEKRHHNGTDIWSGKEPCWIEAPYAGTVISVSNSPTGFGSHVILRHKIRGKVYTTLYGHMIPGSIKVKNRQRVDAGTPLGKMGTSGTSTGKHLHWELHKGRTHTWSSNGAGYIEPVAFFKALIKWEQSIATAAVTALETDPVQPEAIHGPTPAPATAAAPQPAVTSASPARSKTSPDK
jgi:murein DD-endopeptidase MepM/ murein hydrolase activator NlpD